MGTNCQTENETTSLPSTPGKERYTIEKLLAKGNTGEVSLIRHLSSGKLSILKTLKPHEFIQEAAAIETCENMFENEIRGHKLVNGHPNVVLLRNHARNLNGTHLHLEFCSGGDLCSYLMSREGMRLEEQEAAVIIRQVASALKHCHLHNLIHGDVKAENVLIAGTVIHSNGRRFPFVKLSDFGSCELVSPGKDGSRGLVGTILYTAPEIVKKIPYQFGVDIWALGVLMYASLSGTLPFYGNNKEAIFESICERRILFEEKVWSNVSEEAKDLILWMLTRDVKKRATAEDVLKHPWIVANTGEKLFAEVMEEETATASEEVQQKLRSIKSLLSSQRTSSQRCDLSLVEAKLTNLKLRAKSGFLADLSRITHKLNGR